MSEQGTGAWLAERCGCVTASRFKDVVAKLKTGKPATARQTYLMELVVERLTGHAADHFTSAAMEWGTQQEASSRMDYEARTGQIVEETGFIKHPAMPHVGGSPDGLIGDDGGWESKSPFNTGVHLMTILEGMPEDHVPQVQGLMWITGRVWWDYQSYDPRLPEPLCRYVQRVKRDDAYIAELAKEVIAFEAEVCMMVEKLKEIAA